MRNITISDTAKEQRRFILLSTREFLLEILHRRVGYPRSWEEYRALIYELRLGKLVASTPRDPQLSLLTGINQPSPLYRQENITQLTQIGHFTLLV